MVYAIVANCPSFFRANNFINTFLDFATEVSNEYFNGCHNIDNVTIIVYTPEDVLGSIHTFSFERQSPKLVNMQCVEEIRED